MKSSQPGKPVDMMLDLMGNSDKIPKRLVKVMSRARKQGKTLDTSAIKRLANRDDIPMDEPSASDFSPRDSSPPEPVARDPPRPSPPQLPSDSEDDRDNDSAPEQTEDERVASDGDNSQVSELASDSDAYETVSERTDAGSQQTERTRGTEASGSRVGSDSDAMASDSDGDRRERRRRRKDDDDDSQLSGDSEGSKNTGQIDDSNSSSGSKSSSSSRGSNEDDSDDSSDDDYYKEKAKKSDKLKYSAKQLKRLARKKEKMLDKFDKLTRSYAAQKDSIPRFSLDDDYGQMKRSYRRIRNKLTLDASIESNQMYLIVVFMMIEWVFTSYLGMDIEGFAKDQIVKINNYNKLMIELGEKKYMSIGGTLPVEVRILGMALFNALIMFVLKKMNGTGQAAELPKNEFLPSRQSTQTTSQQIQPLSSPIPSGGVEPEKTRMKGPSIRYGNDGERMSALAV
jgi:hypothetical protein